MRRQGRTLATVVVAATLALSLPAQAGNWFLSTDTRGAAFFDDFDFVPPKVDVADSLARYVTQKDAQKRGLAYVDATANDAFVLKVDSTTANTTMRDSVRIHSNTLYGDGLYVLDVNHTPQGCGTWPAFWSRTSTPRSAQELDMIETVNDKPAGPLTVLHTDAPCVLSDLDPAFVPPLGRKGGARSCMQSGSNSSGCVGFLQADRNDTTSAAAPSLLPWGAALTNGSAGTGGAVYVIERALNTSGTVTTWAFARADVPVNLAAALTQSNGLGARPGGTDNVSVDTSGWRTPNALLNLPGCQETWRQHYIVLNIALCGNWATGTYDESGCAARYGSCANQVAIVPGTFNASFWSVNSFTVFANTSFARLDNAPNTGKSAAMVTVHAEVALVLLSVVVASSMLFLVG